MRLLRDEAAVAAPQRQLVAALGLARLGQAYRLGREQDRGGLQEALGRARLQLQLGLAQLVLRRAGAHHALVEGELQIALVGVQLARGARDDGLELRLQRRAP